jgi:hypothetical protein
MVLPLIQMETTSRSTGKNSKASQGGLTPPKLYQLGPDFQNRSRKTRKRRQVRISCIFVAHYFSARVKSQIVTGWVCHCIPLHPIAHVGCIPSHTIAYHRIPSHTIAYHRIPSHTIAYHRIPSYTVPPPMENDRTPSSGK